MSARQAGRPDPPRAVSADTAPDGPRRLPDGSGGATRLLWDTHCHLADPRFAADREAVLDRARSVGIAGVVMIGADPDAWPAVTALAAAPAVLPLRVACGLHPHAAERGDDPCFALLRTYLRGAVALGEIGLDYHYDLAPRQRQQRAFSTQLQMARELDLPILLHERDAVEDLLAILRSEGLPPRGGVWHCFSHGPQVAEQAVALGLHLGFGGLITFARGTEAVRAAAGLCPADRLVLETDAPYLAPVPWRGRRNEPALVVHVLDFLSGLRRESPDALAEITSRNASRLFQRSAAAS